MRPHRLAGGLRVGAAGAACVAIAFAVSTWIDGRTSAGLGRDVELLAPEWLYLACLAPLFFLLRSLSLTDLSVAQQCLHAAIRSLVLVSCAVALSRPSAVTHDDRVASVVLVDVSDSVSDAQLASARHYVDELAASRGDGSLQVVTFSERPRVVRDEGGHFTIERHAAGAGTDVQAAMQLAYGIYPDGHLARMVIVSDGLETAGDMRAEAYRARELGVRVSWRTFDEDKVREVRVVGLHVPDEIKVGQPFEVTAEIWSTHDDAVALELRQDEFPNPLEPSKQATIREGTNRITFKSEARRAGATTFRVRLSRAGHDTETANNAAVITAPVKGRPSVLYVEGGGLREPGSSSYLERALEHEDIDVEVRGPRGLPSTAKDLEKFDLVIVSDVPAHLIGMGQMAALDSYVQQLGGGLIMAGGEDSFGSGGYQATRIEEIMPVRFDSEKVRDQPDIALALVMDKSGSMEGARLEAAKESARVTAEVLSANDIITVIVFDTEATVFVRPQRASNRTRISAEISRLQSGGGTHIFPGLQAAFDVLQGINAKVKHVIVLSDGEAPYDGIVELVQSMRAARITVSCVGVHGSDRNLLSLISENGDGRLYMVEDLGALPRIFMKETTEAQRSQLVEDVIHVRVAKQVEMIEGTGVENAPPLHGYVSTKPKPTAEVVLISDLGEPILARWRHGAGTSVAWTSDVKNRWSSDWIAWAGYPRFWAQVVRTSMRRKTYDSYELAARVDDGRAVVEVDAIDSGDRFVNGLDTTLEIVDPGSGRVVRDLEMQQVAPGRYAADFRLERYGSYLLKAVHRREGRTVAESLGAVALSYPVEYLRTTPDVEALSQVAIIAGGVSQVGSAQVWDAGDESVVFRRDLWPWVLLVTVALLLFDVYVKRVRLFGYRTMGFDGSVRHR